MTAPAQRACYVYGIMREPRDAAPCAAAVAELPAVADPNARVEFVSYRGLAAVVSDVPTDRALGTPGDLQAHARVLDALAALREPVLPFRFGTVVRDAAAASGELLASGYDGFVTALDRLEGLTQFTLRARYVESEVLREVLDEQPQIQRLRSEVGGLPESAGYYERIELGRMISDAITAKRSVDSAEIEHHLAPFTVAMTTAQPAAADGVVDASFLVGEERRQAFERAADDLAARWQGRVRMRLLGPLAPYDFVSEAMSDIKEGGG